MKRIILIVLGLSLLTGSVVMAQDKPADKKKNAKSEKRRNYQEQEEWQEEDTLRRWEFGLNFGAYFANKYSANYYNGTPGNINNVQYVLRNKYWYNDIYKALKASDTVVVQYDRTTGADGYPRNMHYNVVFSGGLYVRMNLDKKNALFIEANYARLTAADVLVLEVDPQVVYQRLPILYYQPIVGKEGRVMIDLGYQRNFRMKSKIFFFLQGAATMCYTQVIKSFFEVGSVSYSMINIYADGGYVPGANTQEFNVYQNTFGFGGYIGTGFGIPLTNAFGIEPLAYMQYYPTNLAGYKDFKPSFGLSLRLMINLAAQE
jgi:Ni/Co efflux regulator RcnB